MIHINNQKSLLANYKIAVFVLIVWYIIEYSHKEQRILTMRKQTAMQLNTNESLLEL